MNFPPRLSSLGLASLLAVFPPSARSAAAEGDDLRSAARAELGRQETFWSEASAATVPERLSVHQ